ncbi:uncharacterized protein LOC133173108 [Saccostrea echinata]|uniref:uncharacterized protein LOC133173108 n=1 Tax=Saccostrea echinata TaxID=191078 RepID=UPI002A81613E|nr:uncharacterized protein LOC133173108 [Saccostrea echinata]
MLIKLVKTALEMRDIYITTNDNNDVEKESESQDSFTSDQTMQLRRSMFGIKSTLYKSSKRNSLEDFDDIRSILSHSKVEENWESHINEDGGVFYVDVTKDADQSQKRRRHGPASARARHRRRRLNDHHCQCHFQPENETKSEIRNEVRIRNGVNTPSNFDIRTVNINYLESLIDYQSQILASGENNNNRTTFDETHSTPEITTDLRQIYVLPKEHTQCSRLHQDSFSRIIHFHAYFGAFLCHHNQCAQPKAGIFQGMVEETKFLVQYVEPDSPAAKAGVKKGDILLCLDDIEVSLYMAERLLESPPKHSVKWTLKTTEEINSESPNLILKPLLGEPSTEQLKTRKQVRKSLFQLLSRGVNPKISSFLKKLTQHFVSDVELEELKVR